MEGVCVWGGGGGRGSNKGNIEDKGNEKIVKKICRVEDRRMGGNEEYGMEETKKKWIDRRRKDGTKVRKMKGRKGYKEKYVRING